MAPVAQMSSPKLGAGSIASRWRELQGSKSWEGLLKPLDADLRASIIAYGELAEAAYDGFNDDENTPDAGACLYSLTGLLAASGVSHPEYYTVTKFLYATSDLVDEPVSELLGGINAFFVRPAAHLRDGPWWKRANWIGYVAVATDEGAAALGRRDIVVAWRGTVEKLEMFKDIVFAAVSAATLIGPSLYGIYNFPHATVHAGFLSVYTAKQETSPDDKELQMSAGEQALEELRRLMEVHKEEETSITVTGHSLGAALATMNAVDIVVHGVNVRSSSSGERRCPVTAFVFACPQVGNADFKAALASFPDLRALHVKNAWDIVPTLPTAEFAYVDTATVTLDIDTYRSPYIRPQGWLPWFKDDLLRSHNLECYLHGLAGDQGAGNDFKLVVDRDLALVNKGSDSLKEDYPVPAKWWEPNSKYKVKGLVARFKLDYFNEE